MTEQHSPSMSADGAAQDQNVLDIVEGIDRVMGDRDLYERMLRRFRKDYVGGDRLIRVALAAGDRALAHRLSHTLKGAAGMIGARSLHQLASTLETALRTASGNAADCLNALTPVLADLIAALDHLLDGAVPATSHREQPGAAMADPALLARLLDLLVDGDGAAIDLLDESEAGLRLILGAAQFEEVAAAANEFDYERALGALRARQKAR